MMKEILVLAILATTVYAGVSFNNSIGSQYDRNINTVRDRMMDRQFYTGYDAYNSNRRR